MLNFSISGPKSDLPPVVLVHGLFGSGRNLGGIARRLAQDRQVIVVDMRNHGDSFHAPDHSYAAMADDLAEVIEAQGGIADIIGHSMGGKAAMVLALTRPELVRNLAVMDISPVAYDHDQTRILSAMETLDRSGLKLRSDADRRMSTSLSEPGVRAFLLQSLDLKTEPAQWKMNLPALRANMSEIIGWPGDLTPGSFTGPALFLAGAQSDYCDTTGVAAIHHYFPQARVTFIESAGHWIHAEQPETVGNHLAQFLKP